MGQCGAHLSCWVIKRQGIQERPSAPSQGQAGVQKGQCCGSVHACLPASHGCGSPLFAGRQTHCSGVCPICTWDVPLCWCVTPSTFSLTRTLLTGLVPPPPAPDKPGGSHFEILHLRASAKIFSLNKFNSQIILGTRCC